MSSTAAPSFDIALACGFEPLSLKRYLRQQLARRIEHVALRTSGYGGLETMLQQVAGDELVAARVVAFIEWSDLDPRLGLRSEVPLTRAILDSVVHEARESAERIALSLGQIGARAVLVPPTLPLPPFFPTRPEHASAWQCALRSIAASLCTRACDAGVAVLDIEVLAVPIQERRSARNEIRFGFPFSEAHARDLASHVSGLISPTDRKKGLVLDLDGTLWKGIVGDDGVDAVGWSLNDDAIGHALLQRTANLLGDSGILLGVVTKNEPATAEGGLSRPDLIVSRESLWPVVAGWQQKSAGVDQIAKTWNIGSDAMVMLDDSALELAEVAGQIDGITALQFDGNDPEAILQVLTQLRELFGSVRTTEEDRLRAQSLRSSTELAAMDKADVGRHEAFLAGLAPQLIVTPVSASTRDRAIELVNKTNQFNLTGARVGPESELAFVKDGELWLFEYTDRLARLGVIGVLRTESAGDSIMVTHWVLSCRAFARRVEHAMLAYLAEQAGDRPICFPFVASARNAPTERFLLEVFGSVPSSRDLWSSRDLLERLPPNRPAPLLAPPSA